MKRCANVSAFLNLFIYKMTTNKNTKRIQILHTFPVFPAFGPPITENIPSFERRAVVTTIPFRKEINLALD